MLTASEGLPREHLLTLLRKWQQAPSWAKPTSFRSQSATLSQHRAPVSILLSMGLIIRDSSSVLGLPHREASQRAGAAQGQSRSRAGSPPSPCRPDPPLFHIQAAQN